MWKVLKSSVVLQPVRFKLNHASTTGKPGSDNDFSLWIGDLSPEVDDYQLYRLLASRYHSLRTAKGKYRHF
jgi:RNA recognition motif-containing protein